MSKDNPRSKAGGDFLSEVGGIWLPRRDFIALGLAAGATTLLPPSAAHAGAAKPPSAPKGQVVVGLSQEPTVFNPLMPGIEVDQGVWWNLFSPLWGVDPDGKFTPKLAKEVPSPANGGISADGLTWVVKLRDDVKWHDGTAFTADDVKYSLDLVNNPNFRARSRNGHNLVRDIKVVSPTEISWRMDKAYSPYASILAWTFIVPKHILEKASDPNTAPFNNAPVGTGPFKWGSRVPGDHIILEANRSYFEPGPYLERVVFKYIPELTVLYTQFRTGEVDHVGISGITPDNYAEAKGLRGRKLHLFAQPNVEHIAPNHGHPVLGDKAVRQGLYYALNKRAIIDAIYYGVPSTAETFLPKQSWAYESNLPAHEYNPAKANQTLDAAGWKRGSDGVRVKNGTRLEFTNSTTSGNHIREQVQQLLMQDWQGIGAAMKINNMPPAVVFGEYWVKSKFESILVAVNFMIGPDPDVTHRFGSQSISARGGAGQNNYQYVNAKIDELLLAGTQEFDQEKRKEIYRQVQQILREDLAILPMFQGTIIEGSKENLMGFAANVNVMSNCWNIGQWYWAS